MSRFLSFMTIVSIGSVAVGVAALIITFTILDGFERELRSNIIGLSAHIRVSTFRNQALKDDASTLSKIQQLDGVSKAAPYFQQEAITITRDNIEGVIVKGIVEEKGIYLLRSKLVGGEASVDSLEGKPGILVGKRFADKMGLGVGDKLVLIGVSDAQDLMNAPKIQFRITGIYETGMAEYYDDLYVFVDLPIAQRLFRSQGHVNGYDVLCTDIEGIEDTVVRLQQALGYPFDPQSVFSIFRNLFVWIDLQRELIPLVVGSLIFISVFNIVATLLLFVIEKTQEIGILKALGASRQSILRIFIMQGLIIGTVGAGLGSLLAFAFSFLQAQFKFFSLPDDIYYMTSVPIYMKPEVFILVSGLGVLLALLSAAIPAWLGSRLQPLRSIRFY